MSHSEDYYDAVHHDEDFNDSIILQPISLKPTVIPSLLNRSNPQNTILAAYDKIKLTQFIDQTQDGSIIELISLQENSNLVTINPEGIELLQKYSGTQIAFITVTGQNSSGKSFFLDKILNLSNVQGNHFTSSLHKPSMKVWSVPFAKEELKIFIAEVSGCAPGSKHFDIIFPYATILSSLIINFEEINKQKIPNKQSSLQKLQGTISKLLADFHSNKLSGDQNKNQVLGSIFPKMVYQIKRKDLQVNSEGYQNLDVRTQQIYLPNAKNPQYRGIDEDLLIHSFMNKKCINQKFIEKTSQIFHKVYREVTEKKHRELVFNGGIMLKYLGQASLIFQKAKKIDISTLYQQIVRDLYISAYNYCVICYHEDLQSALSDEKPKSLDVLLEVFQGSSNSVLEKFNEFNLQPDIHYEYEQKLLKHIQSKQRLILDINKKKTDLQLRKIYDESIDMSDLTKVWSEIQKVNKKYPDYTHGKDQTIGGKLGEVIQRLKVGNNVDYRAMKEIQRLKQNIETKTHQLTSIKEEVYRVTTENNEQKKKQDLKKNSMISQKGQLETAIEKIKKVIKMYQNVDQQDPVHLKEEQHELIELSKKRQKQIQKLNNEANEPVQKRKQIIDLQKKIDLVKSSIQLLEQTQEQMQRNLATNQNNQAEQTQMKLKKQAPKTQQRKSELKQPQKMNRSGNQPKPIKQSKGNKKETK